MIGLLLSLALSQGLSPNAPGVTGGGKVLASFPLVTSGPLITEDANTVAHVYWNGTALVDTKGNAWTQNGTVPQVTANPFTSVRYGAGPFSDANYYSLGTGTDVLDFAGGEFTICVAWVPPTTAAQRIVNNTNAAATAGWQIVHKSGGGASVYVGTGAGLTETGSANAVVAGGPNVVCGGRDATKSYVKLNLGTTASATVTFVPDTETPFRIGILGAAESIPQLGTIYEVYATSTPFTEATVTAIQQKVLGHYDGYSPLAVTRTTNATYAPRSAEPYTLFTAAPGVARITDQGLLVEPARTSVSLNSDALSVGTAANTNWQLGNSTVTTVAGAPMGTWAEVTGTAADGRIFSTPSTAGAVTQLVASAWAQHPTASGTMTLLLGSGATNPATACTCVRSDAGACTAAIVTDFCQVQTTVGTTPVRVSGIYTITTAATAHVFRMYPGDRVVTGAVMRFGAVDFVGSATFPTSHISVAGTATARNADAVSATVPAVPAGATGKWCLAVTAQPEEGRAWATSGYTMALSMGTFGAANSTSVNFYSDGKMYWSVRDATAGDRYIDPAFTFTAGSAHRVVVCNSGGTLKATWDGSPVTATATGPGAGVFGTSPTSLRFGDVSSGAYTFGGYLKNLKICGPAKNAKECK